MLLRPFVPGEEGALRALFVASVHALASANYSGDQVAAWAPEQYDQDAWALRIQQNQPLVALIDGQLAGFADLQSSGYIDQFFVSPQYARMGVGTALLARLLGSARAAGLPSVYSHVSLTAEPLFAQHGFIVERRNEVAVRGAVLRNATMRLALNAG